MALATSRALLITLCFLLQPLTGCRSAAGTARVIEVVDGDTVVIESGQRVRYIGIDTPELGPPAEPFAIEAWQANRVLVGGKVVRLEKDTTETDRYGRLLRYVYVDGTFVNAELVRQGLARARDYPPDTRHQDFLNEMEDEARQASRGVWAR